MLNNQKILIFKLKTNEKKIIKKRKKKQLKQIRTKKLIIYKLNLEFEKNI